MFPIFVPNDPDRMPRSRRTSLKIAALGGIVALGLVFMLLMMRTSGGSVPWVAISVGVLVVVIIPIAMLFSRGGTDKDEAKAKRALQGLDLYSVIDRLVDDIDDDEAAYLQRRLDERKAKNKDDLTVSLDELLEKRAEDRGDR